MPVVQSDNQNEISFAADTQRIGLDRSTDLTGHRQSAESTLQGFNYQTPIQEELRTNTEFNGGCAIYLHLVPLLMHFRFQSHLISAHGYPFEEHRVQSADGYILTLFRIPGTPANPSPAGKPVVFVQHGLLSSSADWVVTGPGHGLGYLLADSGYDVWLGNARGNTHGRQHVTMSPNSRAFWEFSWHEIGVFDLPAMIDYALSRSGASALHYIGHSQGTTSFFVMASMRPEYNAKIRSMHALAPVAFMSNLASPFIRVISPFVDSLDWIMSMLGINEFLPSTTLMELGGYILCRDTSPFQEVCANVLFLIGGFNSAQLNRTMIPAILQNTPAGASVNQLVHYGQGVNSARFRQYDHGFLGNLNRYGSRTPPDYPLGRITAPVALHFSDNDWLAAVSVSSLNPLPFYVH